MISSFVTIKDLPTFDKLIDESRFHISSPVSLAGEEKVSKMKNKYNLLTIIDNGYRSLPKPYHEAFLDPLKNLILTQDFGSILNTYGGGEATLLEDWIACIDQRSRKFSRKKTDDLSAQTMAFTELCADIYDGYVSRSVRKDALLPESQLLAPLTKWGGTGAYTHSVRAGIGIGMKASIINLPIQYSKNIALWPLSVHECYHDVVEAYGGLLNEVEDRISEEFESAKMRKAFKRRINWNGEKDLSISEFAAEYWRRTMSETLADICGVLNIGPAGGISFAVLALAQGSKDIVPKSYIDDPHPNDVLRVRIAVEVIRHFKGLALNIREAYVAFLNQLIEKYVNEKNYLVLYCNDLDGNKIDNIVVPFRKMGETVKRVVELIAFTRLKALGNHSLYELNTWTNRDEVLTQRIAEEFLKNKIPYLGPGPDEQEVYAAHLVAAATLALVKRPEIERISNLAIQALSKLYQANPVWRGLSVLFRSDVELHDVSTFNNKNLVKRSKSEKSNVTSRKTSKK